MPLALCVKNVAYCQSGSAWESKRGEVVVTGFDLNLELGLGVSSGAAAVAAPLAGASTTAIADSLQVETDVLVAHFKQGNSGVALVRDSGTPANDLDIVELTQQDTDILDYTAPHIKNVTGPAGLQRYAAHNKFRTATTWENAGAGAGDSNVTISGNDVTFNAASAYTFRASGGTVGGGLIVGRYKLTSDTTVSNVRCRLYGSTDAVYLDTTLESLTAGVASVIELSGDGVASAQQCQMVIDQRSGGDDLSGVTITIEEVQVYNGPADSTYLANTGTDRFAIPQFHVASTLDSSTTALTIGLGSKTITTASNDNRFERLPVVNGGFDADTDWTKGTNTTITGGVLSVNSTGATATTQELAMIRKNENCTITVTVAATGGTVQINLGGSLSSALGTGSHSFKLAKGVSHDDVRVVPSAGFTGTVDDLVVDRGVIDVRLSDTANVDTNWMTATATSHDGTALVVNVDHISGSGSISSWHIIEIEKALIELAATNQIVESEDFSTWWLGLSEVVTSASTPSPNGETTASTLADDNSSGSKSVGIYKAITVSTSTTYTLSVFAKEKQVEHLCLRAHLFTTPASSNCFFNLNTGAKGTQDAGWDDANIEYYGDGWYRCSVTFTTDAADTTGNIYILVCDTDNNILTDADGTSDIYLFGAQLEEGSVPTSYIPTAGSTVARAADDLSMAASELPIGTTEHFILDHASVRDASTGGYMSELHEATTDRIATRVNGSNAKTLVQDGAATQAALTVGAVAADTPFKLASVFKANDFASSVDGASVVTDTSGTLGITPASFAFGKLTSSGGELNGGLKFTKYLPRADISGADMQAEAGATLWPVITRDGDSIITRDGDTVVNVLQG
ncbi:MAG: hypothetical protein GY952_14080 [Rhodobacteraceae bacterium]|nr:hypothetical protein [Paracoccaceae bacterium]